MDRHNLFQLARCIFLLLCFIMTSEAFPEPGRWHAVLNNTNQYFGVFKSLFHGSKIFVRLQCETLGEDDVQVWWQLRETPCWNEYRKINYLTSNEKQLGWSMYFDNRGGSPSDKLEFQEDHLMFMPPVYQHRCDNSINLNEYSVDCNGTLPSTTEIMYGDNHHGFHLCQNLVHPSPINPKTPVVTIPTDGVYLFIIKMTSTSQYMEFTGNVVVEIKGSHGYLSAAEYPLLIFYEACCVLYASYGLLWLSLMFIYRKEILRLQLWIGGVILIGMIEVAVFYAEFHSINSTGSVTGAALAAEIISCAKRTLARVLVIVVSLGYGIVKPRLGEHFHRILLVAGLYFILATVESCLRILQPARGPSGEALLAGICLSFLDASIFYWIFQSLLTTTRTLRLRRNAVKLKLYRIFTSALLVSVTLSVGFMIWSIGVIKTPQCLKEWRKIWLDEAFWQSLFAVILLVIMILWRPNSNNRRFSFSSLMDDAEEDEEELVVNEAFARNMTLRQKNAQSSTNPLRRNNEEDTDPIVPAIDLSKGDLPALDSEEEVMSTRFELSKMQ